MKLVQRLDRLEAVSCGSGTYRPDVIFIRAVLEPGEYGPRVTAMILRWPDGVAHLERGEGETEADFELRVDMHVRLGRLHLDRAAV